MTLLERMLGEQAENTTKKKADIEYISEVEKFNPYHDRLGRFTSPGSASSFTIRTRGGAYQQGMVNRAIEREKQRTASKNYKLEITGTNHKLPRLDSEQAEKDRTDAIGKVEEKVNVYAPFMGAKGKAMIDKEFEKYVSETDPKVWSRRAKLSRDDAWYDFKGTTREEAEKKQRDLEAKRAEEKRKSEDVRNMKEAISRAKEKKSKKAQAFFEYENELRNKYRDESLNGPEKYNYWSRATDAEKQKLNDLEAALVMRDKHGKWRVAKTDGEFWDDDWEYTENNQGFQKSVPQNAGVDCIIELEKFNPYHDARGKFATADGTNSRVDPRPGRVDRHNGKGQKKNSRNKNRDADNKPMSIEKALEGTNPHFNSKKGDYKNNCQRCVQVYEMRRRGMDVSAAPYPGRHNNIAWGIECFTKSGTHKEAGRLLKRNMSKKDLEAALNNAPINSRHVIYVKKINDEAHVFIAEKLKNGVLFVDPQSNEKNCIQHLTGVMKNGYGICRVDNRPLTSNQSAILNTIEVKRK